MIIQMPVFIALYQVLGKFLEINLPKTIMQINGALYFSFLKINTIDPWFFGINLATTPQKGGNVLYYVIPVITAVLQYLQVQTATPAMTPSATNKEIVKKVKKERRTTAVIFKKQ